MEYDRIIQLSVVSGHGPMVNWSEFDVKSL